MLPKKEYMITTRSDRQTDRLLFKKRSRSRPALNPIRKVAETSRFLNAIGTPIVPDI